MIYIAISIAALVAAFYLAKWEQEFKPDTTN